MIDICYGLYDRNGRYSKFVGTSMVSIFENTSEKITIHILHDNTLTEDNLSYLNEHFQYIFGAGGFTQYCQYFKSSNL